MFNPDGCFCCLPPEDPCTVSGCTFLSDEMSDSEINSYWTQVVASSGAVGNGSYTVTNAQDNDVGNDAPSRRVTLVTANPTTTSDNVYLICWKKSSTHNPSTQCPITNITFCVESKRVSESDGQVRFFVKQNGSTYVTKTGFSIGVNWKRATGTFSQSDFEELSSGAQPNFTASGTAIEFGFGLKIPVNSGDEPFADVWFDNLCVVVAKQCPTPLCTSDVCDVIEDSPPSGSLVSKCSVDPFSISFGTQPRLSGGSEAYALIDWGGTSPHGPAQYMLETGVAVDFSGECRTVSSVSLCVRLRADASIAGTCAGVSGSCRLANVGVGIKQSGSYYLSGTAGAALNHGSSGILHSVTLTNSMFRVTSFPLAPIGSQCYPNTSATVDLSQPFEIVLIGNANGSVTVTTGTEYLQDTKVVYDNICVRAALGCDVPFTQTVAISGLSVTGSLSHPQCDASVVSQINSVLSSALLMTPITGSPCGTQYSSGWIDGPIVSGSRHRAVVTVTVSRSMNQTVVGGVNILSCIGPPSNPTLSCTTLLAHFGTASGNADCDNGEVLPYRVVPGATSNTAHCLSWNPAGSSITTSYT